TGSFALAAYLRTIFTNRGTIQSWLKGDMTALTEKQKEGAVLFFGKAGCARCHNSPSLNTLPHQFFCLGVKNEIQTGNKVFRTDRVDRRNLGREGFTYEKADMD